MPDYRDANFLVFVLACVIVVWSIPLLLFVRRSEIRAMIDPELDNPYPMPGVRYVRAT